MMKLIGIDPGTNYCGVATFTVENFTITNLETRLIDSTWIDTGLFDKLLNVYNETYKIFLETLPIWLAIEAGFINRFRPAAYGPISKCIFSIEKAYYDATGLKNITELPPSIVKKFISQNGLATKGDMLTAVSNIPEISKFLKGNETEHEIDAIAIGYTKLKTFLDYPELLLLY